MAAPVQTALITPFPFGVSSFGMPVIGDDTPTTGRIFFVDSTAASKGDDTQHGSSPLAPFATIDFAIGQCTANRGDRIYVLPGHAEDITAAAGINCDVAGVQIVGLGEGRARPRLTFKTTTAASIDINAASVTLKNLVLDMTGIDGIGTGGAGAGGVRVKASDALIIGNEIIIASVANQVANAIGFDTNAHRLLIINNLFFGTNNNGPDFAIQGYGAGALTVESVSIIGNRIVGAFTDSAIKFDFTDILINVLVAENEITNMRANLACLSFIVGAGSFGIIRNNRLLGSYISSLYTQTAIGFANVDNYGYDSDTAGALGQIVPVVGYELPATKSLIDQILGQEFSVHQANYLAVAVDFSSATWNTIGTHEILAFGGAAPGSAQRVIIIPECTTDLTSGGAATITLGHELNAAAYIAATTATDIDQGELWLSATPAKDYAKTSVIDRVISGAIDIGYEIAAFALTGGGITFHCWIIPLNSLAQRYPSAGAGGAL